MSPEAPRATPAAASCISPDMASGTPSLDQQQAFAGSELELTQPQVPQNEEEQALEIHEVIELQAFSERKAWIEDKIKVRMCHSYPYLQVNGSLSHSSWRRFRPSRFSSGWTPYEPLQRTFLVYPHANNFRNGLQNTTGLRKRQKFLTLGSSKNLGHSLKAWAFCPSCK
jgi:hypothetical protein